MSTGRRGATLLVLPVSLAASGPAQAGELHDAVQGGDLTKVQALLDGGADVDEPGLFGTALHLAVSKGHVDIARALIAAGADLEAEGDPADAHPLHLAVQSNQLAAVALLVERGAVVDSRDGQDRTPLMLAVSSGYVAVAEALVAAGADVRATEEIYRLTPLHYAAMRDSAALTQLLLSNGADPGAGDASAGSTALHYATMEGHLDAIKALADGGADLTLPNKAGETPMTLAATAKQTQAVELLRRLGAAE